MSEKTIINAELGQTLDRTIPITLRPYFSKHEWDPFCDKADKYLIEGRTNSRIVYALMLCGVALGFIMFVLGGLKSSVHGPSPIIFVAMIIFIGSPLLGMACLSCSLHGTADRMKELCETTSREKPSISMHFKMERVIMPGYHFGHNTSAHSYSHTYIEVLHPRAPAYATDQVTAMASAIPVEAVREIQATAPLEYQEIYLKASARPVEIPYGGDDTARQRLEDLERIKDMLSPGEYDEKRKEILTSI